MNVCVYIPGWLILGGTSVVVTFGVYAFIATLLNIARRT